MPVCPMCAEPIAEGAAKCPSCGETLAARPAPPSARRPFFSLAGCALLFFGCSVVAVITIPGGHGPTPRGNEAGAIGALKTIATAQLLFREGDKDGDGTLDYAGSLTELSDRALIDGILGGGTKQGYVFQLGVSATSPELGWMATATPVVPGKSGTRYFVTNDAGIIHYSTTAPFAITPDCAIPRGALPLGR